MKVKVITSFSCSECGAFSDGDTPDLPQNKAQEFIKAGFAEQLPKRVAKKKSVKKED